MNITIKMKDTLKEMGIDVDIQGENVLKYRSTYFQFKNGRWWICRKNGLFYWSPSDLDFWSSVMLSRNSRESALYIGAYCKLLDKIKKFSPPSRLPYWLAVYAFQFFTLGDVFPEEVETKEQHQNWRKFNFTAAVLYKLEFYSEGQLKYGEINTSLYDLISSTSKNERCENLNLIAVHENCKIVLTPPAITENVARDVLRS